jgi:UDP-2,3-diacylglucosamine hydrolase
LANRWSHARRKKEPLPKFTSRNNELLIKHAENLLQNESYDYFIFGHRHIPMQLDLSAGAKLINTGEWLNQQTFACLNIDGMQLLRYKKGQIKAFPFPDPGKNPYIQKK